MKRIEAFWQKALLYIYMCNIAFLLFAKSKWEKIRKLNTHFVSKAAIILYSRNSKAESNTQVYI